MLRQFALIALSLAGLVGCTTLGTMPTKRIASAILHNTNGLPAGTAVLIASGDSLTLNLAAASLPAGGHGLHLHMIGKCEVPTFSSAGGHLNPEGHMHGTANPAGSHLGDLPNLTIDAQGASALSIELRGSRADLEAALFDSDGSAIVVHADLDDYKTDPSGNSGARIACGVLRSPGKS